MHTLVDIEEANISRVGRRLRSDCDCQAEDKDSAELQISEELRKERHFNRAQVDTSVSNEDVIQRVNRLSGVEGM